MSALRSARETFMVSEASARLAEAEGLVTAGLHLTHEEEDEAGEEQEREGVQKDKDPVTATDFLDIKLDGLVAKSFGNLGSIFLGNGDVELAVDGSNVFPLKLVAVGGQIERDLFHIAFIDLGHELAIARSFLASSLAVAGNQLPEHDAQEDDGDPEENRFCRRTGIHISLTIYPLPES